MTESQILYSKEGFTFTKNTKNNYSLCFQMQNNHINLSKIIDFNLIKLIYDLNPDIYEKINIQPINENEATVYFLMKHLFEDLGMPQRYSYVHMSRNIQENNIKFISQSIKDIKPIGLPIDVELLPIRNMICDCKIVNEHTIHFSCNIIFENTMIVPQIAEKLLGLIINKIFIRVKQFIENIQI